MKLSQILNLDVIKGLQSQPDNYYDIVLIDPPYNVGKNFGNNNDDMDLKDYITWCKEWTNGCLRCMKDSGTMYIYGFAEILAHISVNLDIEHKWLVWHYTNKTVPSLKFWQRSHESILCCWKDKDKKIFNVDDVREEYTNAFLKNAGKKRKATKGRFSNGNKETTYNANPKGALPRDVIKVPALASRAGLAERWFYSKSKQQAFPNKEKSNFEEDDIIQHPTQKPYKITKKLLLAAKPKDGGKVLIPFVGSGAECAVAEDLGMEYLGFEINEDYVKLSHSFLEKRHNYNNFIKMKKR